MLSLPVYAYSHTLKALIQEVTFLTIEIFKVWFKHSSIINLLLFSYHTGSHLRYNMCRRTSISYIR